MCIDSLSTLKKNVSATSSILFSLPLLPICLCSLNLECGNSVFRDLSAHELIPRHMAYYNHINLLALIQSYHFLPQNPTFVLLLLSKLNIIFWSTFKMLKNVSLKWVILSLFLYESIHHHILFVNINFMLSGLVHLAIL